MPAGWSALGGGVFSRTIDGVEYRINIQLEKTDFLKANYGGNASAEQEVVTAQGTTLQIIRTAGDYVAVSSCKPVNGNGCSPMLGNEYVLILLHGYQPGDQYVRELDFNRASTASVMADFEQLVAALDF